MLHVPKPDLPRLVHQLIKSMKESGVMYCSFKYGDGEREKDGRTFTDLNEDNLREIVFKAGDCCISDMWMSEDKRPDRAENWLNCLINKT